MHNDIMNYFKIMEDIEVQIGMLIIAAELEENFATALALYAAIEALRNEWELLYNRIANSMNGVN